MLVIGGHEMIPYLISDERSCEPKWFKYRFMNPAMIGKEINIWPPRQMFEYCKDYESVEFDKLYSQYLLENDEAFIQFMTPLIGDYYNHNAFLLTDLKSPVIVSLIESYAKLVQCRYGMLSVIVGDQDDMLELPEEKQINIQLYNIFMSDKERYTYLAVNLKSIEEGMEDGKYI